MVLLCKCNKFKINVHNRSLAVVEWMCPRCQETNKTAFSLPKFVHGPQRPFSDINPRSKHIKNFNPRALTAYMSRQASG